MGWTPSHPAFDRNPLDLADDAARAGQSVSDYVVAELKAGRLASPARTRTTRRTSPG